MSAEAPCVFELIDSPVGPLAAAAIADGVCLLEFSRPDRLETQLASLRRWFGGEPQPGRNEHLEQLREELAAYFAGTRTRFTVPLVAPGTPFQERVWAELLRIPYGETRSYGEIARQIGSPGAFRAVGLANGHNPIGIIVPCHRVIGSNGSLTGYGGGLDRKRALLELEKSRVSPVPTLFD